MPQPSGARYPNAFFITVCMIYAHPYASLACWILWYPISTPPDFAATQILTKEPGICPSADNGEKSLPVPDIGPSRGYRPSLTVFARDFFLRDEELRYYCDPQTRVVFGYRDRVEAYIDTPISRMVVDLNRPPLPLPLRDPDGIIKLRTIDGREVYRPGHIPDMHLIHTLLMEHFFPFHQKIDELIDRHPVRIAFDCHSMLPQGSENQKDAGKERPLICLGNNGDRQGQGKKREHCDVQRGVDYHACRCFFKRVLA